MTASNREWKRGEALTRRPGTRRGLYTRQSSKKACDLIRSQQAGCKTSAVSVASKASLSISARHAAG